MKGLALEYVVKWIILLAVAMVVISMVIYFSNNIKIFLAKQTKETKVEPKEINKEYFSSGEILTYALSCWDKTGEKYREDVTCFYLFGNFTNVDKDWILFKFYERYPEGKPKIVLDNFDTSKNYAKIKFREVDLAIVVEN
jgi:hypothetical protein